MKYGHEYNQALASEGFPAAWVSSAISYRQLKKSIKKVQKELSGYGLDAATLQNLSKKTFRIRDPEHATGFVPELWIALDDENGQFLDAGLTDETKAFLKDVDRQKLSIPEDISLRRGSTGTASTGESFTAEAVEDVVLLSTQDAPSETRVRWLRVPLSTATSFFDALDPKLAELEALQLAEKRRLEALIIQLGHAIEALTEPSQSVTGKYKSKADVEAWRDIFALYMESTVFFSSHEQDHGSRSFSEAKSHLEQFSDTLVKNGMVKRFKSPDSKTAFDTFVAINLDILQAMRFQEINAEAMRKILKKFDKRTALGAAGVYQDTALSGPFAKSVATDMCQEISSKVVSVVPQMDDWICPICYGLAWRPIRLGCCNSVYCIRCIIQLQREDKDKCPMCRQPTVMLADQGRFRVPQFSLSLHKTRC